MVRLENSKQINDFHIYLTPQYKKLIKVILENRIKIERDFLFQHKDIAESEIKEAEKYIIEMNSLIHKINTESFKIDLSSNELDEIKNNLHNHSLCNHVNINVQQIYKEQFKFKKLQSIFNNF